MARRFSRTSRPEQRIAIDRGSKVPLHVQISGQLRTTIEDGDIQPGELIENEIDLSTRLGVSRPTLQKAIASLVKNGYVTRKPGRGTVVLPRTTPRRASVGSLFDDLAATGRKPTSTVLTFESSRAPEQLLERLKDDPGPMMHIERVRTADGEPLAILRNWLPAAIVDFSADDLALHGLYALLRQRNVVPHMAEQRMGCRRGTPEENELLTDAAGDPVLTVARTVFDAQAAFLEYGEHCYRAGRYVFETVLVGDELGAKHTVAAGGKH